MAAFNFNFNFHGYDFEHGIMVLSDSLLAATGTLNAKREATEGEWKAYEDAIAAGEMERKEERDEETGALIWEQGMFYEHDVMLINEGIQALRKAFVIALYHHWERIIRQWTHAPSKCVHADLVKLVVAKGVLPPERFEHVYHLNNILKHNSDKSGPQLLDSWPELFWKPDKLKERVAKGDGRLLWQNTITISGPQMDEIFVAIRASGPVANRVDVAGY